MWISTSTTSVGTLQPADVLLTRCTNCESRFRCIFKERSLKSTGFLLKTGVLNTMTFLYQILGSCFQCHDFWEGYLLTNSRKALILRLLDAFGVHCTPRHKVHGCGNFLERYLFSSLISLIQFLSRYICRHTCHCGSFGFIPLNDIILRIKKHTMKREHLTPGLTTLYIYIPEEPSDTQISAQWGFDT